MSDWVVVGCGASALADVRDALADQVEERAALHQDLKDGLAEQDWHRASLAGIDVARWWHAGYWCVPVDGLAEEVIRADPAIVAYAEYVPTVT